MFLYHIAFADINECSLEGTCAPEAVCANTSGSFSCVTLCQLGSITGHGFTGRL